MLSSATAVLVQEMAVIRRYLAQATHAAKYATTWISISPPNGS